MAVNLYPAHKKTDSHAAHKALLTCFLPSCSTWIITHMQRTKNSLCAVHEIWLVCILFRVTRLFWLESRQKLKNTCVFTARECQLIHELYYIINQMWDGFQQGGCLYMPTSGSQWTPKHSWTSDRPQKQASAKTDPSTIGSGVLVIS